jgi:hypothetical protein
MVARSYNMVSVIYLYGQLVDEGHEGNTDWHAIYFSELVVKRARGE